MKTEIVSFGWQTAVSQLSNKVYNRQNLSSPDKTDHTTGNFSIPLVDCFFIMSPASLLTTAGRRANCAVISYQPTIPIRPFSLEMRVMFKDFLGIVRRHSGKILPVTSLLLFVGLSWLYRQQTPLLETPDEPSHFAVVNYIAQHRSLPPRSEFNRTGPAPTVSSDVPFYYAPPLYYLLASPLVSEADTARFAQTVIPNPNFARGIGINLGDGPENKNMYVHTAEQNPPHLAPWAISMNRIRLLSVLLGMATVAGCCALARQLWPENWRWQATAVALVLFNPTFLYLSSGVSNDALLITLSTWSFVLMGSLLQSNKAQIGWREWALALLLGCAILTKQTGFILLPPALWLMLTRARRQQWSRHRLLMVLGIGLVIITAVGGWWYLRNGFLYGDPLALGSHNPLPPADNVLERLLFCLQQSWGAFKSYWAAFGWATIFVESGWYLFFVLLSGLGITGWIWPPPAAKSATKSQFTWILWLAVLLNAALMLVWLWRTAAPYGRLLFSVMAPIACLLTLGWQRWLVYLRWPQQVGQSLLVLPLATLALLAPTYHIQPALASVAVPAGAVGDFSPLNATFGNVYHLLGYTLEPQTVQPGADATLTLFWQRTQPAANPHSIIIYIHLAPLNLEAQIAETSQLLGTPRYPAPFWQPDEVIVQRHQLQIAPDAPAPSLYWFDVVLFDETAQARLPVVWQGERLIEDLFRVGPEPVLMGETAVSTPNHITHYNFNQQIQLNGYTITDNAKSGIEVTLFWQALAQPTVDWTVFIHLVSENGELLTQGDSVPHNGNFPTSWWPVGAIVPDAHWLEGDISCAVLSQYTLLIGFYNPITGERLLVSDGAGQPLLNNAVEIHPTCAVNPLGLTLPR